MALLWTETFESLVTVFVRSSSGYADRPHNACYVVIGKIERN